MSVLARKRQQASTEFEMNCARLVRLTVQRCDSIPKRYQKLVRPKLMQPIMAAYHAVIMANEGDARTEEGREYRRKLFDRATRYLITLQKPMAVYWSLFDTKEGGRREWTDLVCKELALIDGAARYGDGEREVPMIRTFELEYSDDHIFVNKMRDLHKYTYSKYVLFPWNTKTIYQTKSCNLWMMRCSAFCVAMTASRPQESSMRPGISISNERSTT